MSEHATVWVIDSLSRGAVERVGEIDGPLFKWRGPRWTMYSRGEGREWHRTRESALARLA